MAIEYFCAYHSYLQSMELLTDAERGRLFTALLEYSSTGITPEFKGNERFVFSGMRSQIDRDAKNYEEKCRKQSENARKRWQNQEPAEEERPEPPIDDPWRERIRQLRREQELERERGYSFRGG